ARVEAALPSVGECEVPEVRQVDIAAAVRPEHEVEVTLREHVGERSNRLFPDMRQVVGNGEEQITSVVHEFRAAVVEENVDVRYLDRRPRTLDRPDERRIRVGSTPEDEHERLHAGSRSIEFIAPML